MPLVIGLAIVGLAAFIYGLWARRPVLTDDELALQEELMTPIPDSSVVAAGDRVRVANVGSLRSADLKLSFRVNDKSGGPIQPDDLLFVREKLMHVMLVRDDMTGYRNLHPEYVNDAWAVPSITVESGDYQMYVDIAPKDELPIVLRVPLRIGGPTPLPAPPAPNDDLTASDGGVTAKLYPDQWLSSRWRVSLSFVLQNADGSAPELSEFLGAYAHLIIIKHDEPDVFLHAHPTGAVPAGGAVGFETFFPKGGRYTVYMQLIADGTLRTFPITIDVAENPSPPPDDGTAEAERGMERGQ